MEEHPTFAPSEREQIIDFFREQNYVVIKDALTPDELHFLNQFVDGSQQQIPAEWGIGHADIYSHGQILVNHLELDHYARHSAVMPLIKKFWAPICVLAK
jgi:hypothetical protein